jgi:DNA-binding NtrC family response regulator
VRALRPNSDPRAFLTEGVLAAFVRYGWPGNVRELRNAVERLLALGELATPLTATAAPGDAPTPAAPPPGFDLDYHAARRDALERFERDYCRSLLEGSEGVVVRAAEKAGISRQMFHRLLRKHDLTPP